MHIGKPFIEKALYALTCVKKGGHGVWAHLIMAHSFLEQLAQDSHQQKLTAELSKFGVDTSF
jgi:hypothetical protein